MLAGIATGLLMLVCAAAIPAAAAELNAPAPAIVGGHRLQPRADQFSGASTKPDVTSQEARKLQSLYDDVLRASEEHVSNPRSGTPAPASR